MPGLFLLCRLLLYVLYKKTLERKGVKIEMTAAEKQMKEWQNLAKWLYDNTKVWQGSAEWWQNNIEWCKNEAKRWQNKIK